MSVIIPTYNSAALLVEAVRSALAQSLAPFEILVIDDGSRDDTRERMAEFGPPVRYLVQENQGVAAARNRGLRDAGGDAVAFLDADDVWHPLKLERQVRWLNNDASLGLLGTTTIDWPNEPFPPMTSDPAPVVVPFERLVVRNAFTTSSILVRRALLDRVGSFDRALHGPEDFDLWLRAAREMRVANLPQPLTGYRDVVGSLGKQAVSMEAGGRIILGKLKTAGAFRGRPWLERKAWSFLFYSCAYLRGASGDATGAIRLMIQSFTKYPSPYARREVRMPLARPRLLLRSLSRWALSRLERNSPERPLPASKELVNP